MGRGRHERRRPRFPGNLGASLLQPGPESSEYHLVYRFVDDASLAAWERSSERRSALAHVEDMGADDERYVRVTGLDSFFTRPAEPGTAMAATCTCRPSPSSSPSPPLFQLLVTPHLAGLAGRGAAAALGPSWSCCCSGHVAMLLLTRWLARWLHPTRR